MGNVIRGVLESLEYSTTATAWSNPDGATWVEVPVLQIMADGFQNFEEAAQLVQTINQLEASAAKKGVAIWPCAPRSDDSYLDALEAAEAALTPIWFRVKPQGQDYRVLGGPTGGLAYVNNNPMPAFASLVSALVGFSATGAEPGDTFQTVAGSGS